MTLREAAQRTSRSITTLRRYIRSGRLRANKRDGRFGPEYFVSEQDLAAAGLECAPQAADRSLERASEAVREARPRLPHEVGGPLLQEIVPLTLYHELQMKHEQLLVQYGMIRAGGLRVMELRAELESRLRELEAAQQELERLRRRYRQDTADLRRQLRGAHLELHGRALEVDALHEKVRALEMLTRNAVTNEAIERQFVQVMEQSRRVRELGSSKPPRSAPSDPDAPTGSDH